MPRVSALTVARAVSADHELVVVSKNGIVMRTSAGSISQQGRATQGVQVMRVADDTDRVAAVARVDIAEGTDEGGADDGDAPEGTATEPAGA